MDISALWHAEAAWVLAIRDCTDLAWALTRKWALSIHAAKTNTWALTREWALARDTTVCTNISDISYVVPPLCLRLMLTMGPFSQ